MSFSYDLIMIIVAYRAALGGDLGGDCGPLRRAWGPWVVGRAMMGLPTVTGCGAIVLAKPCPIAWGMTKCYNM
jgi:hypothetical protein